MPLHDVNAPHVQAAVAEFNHLGRDKFLTVTGFGRSREYYLKHDGLRYDAEPILSYAHKQAHGQLLPPDDLPAGKDLKSLLEGLGFTVTMYRDPDWTREEIVLACVITADNRWKQVNDTDPRVKELSDLLQAPGIHSTAVRTGKFRNLAGVSRKSADIATQHPDYKGAATNGNRLDRVVLLEYLADPERIRREATAIRQALAAGIDVDAPGIAEPDLDDIEQAEGRLLLRAHFERERKPGLKAKKLAQVKRQGKPIACEVCAFDFAKTYGAHGADYIECHHRTPLFVTGETSTKVADLALICSNCHRMIHRKGADWLSIEDLAAIVRDQRT
ncbi:HNH endonuclease [Phytomonospora sp. NPDC050363]|uniref:HNH endonuclease n=1 Tax=Phytomonospora sp. NPDC050363 TaxID=3155642 RepID=UPI0033D3D555